MAASVVRQYMEGAHASHGRFHKPACWGTPDRSPLSKKNFATAGEQRRSIMDGGEFLRGRSNRARAIAKE